MRVSLLATICVLAMVGCSDPSGSDQEASGPSELKIVAREFAFELPDAEVAAGEVNQVLTNEGEYPHQALLYRLKEGVEFDDFKRQMIRDETVIPQMTDVAGGVSNVVFAGESATSSDELSSGTYAVICFAHLGSEPKNHAEMGMISELSVR